MPSRGRLQWILLAFFVLAQVPLLIGPIGGVHRWRQADTAAVARNLAFESPDLFLPRIDVRGDRSGITGMEFPAYQGTVALLMRFLHSRADVIGKGIALLATVVAWVILARLVARRFRLPALAVYGALACSPILFTYGGRFMPESFGLACGAVALERFERWWETESVGALVIATLAIALAALVRPFDVFFGFPMLWGFLALVRRRDPRAWPLLSAGTLALVPFALWYGLWTPHLVQAYGIDYFFTGYPVSENLRRIGTFEFWQVLFHVLLQEYVSWQLLPFAAFGAWVLWKRDAVEPDGTRALGFGMPLLTIAGVSLLTGRHFSPHTYYLMALLPPVTLWVAFGFSEAWKHLPRAMPWVLSAAVVAVPVAHAYYYRPDAQLALYGDVLPLDDLRVKPGDLVDVEDLGSYAWQLHPLKRRGWVEARAKLEDVPHMEDLARRGCRWVFFLDGHRYEVLDIHAWLARLLKEPPRADSAPSRRAMSAP